jgi:uncharacterized membrane protein YjgN (DUF898 family)|tara:strand:+ start:19869 stop:21056 length:1188 start_codon:yes stop_codon:yes gene_type:complete
VRQLHFEGSGFEYFKIWIVNILLIIITLGVYYPWAKVRNQRYFYANTTLESRNFEYHATGKQLFLGYIMAMALLLVLSIVQNISPLGAVGTFLLLSLIIPWIIWRSLMFTMRMSSFSNVRFRFVGSLKGAYVNFMLLPGALFLCLYGAPGLAFLLLFTLPDSIGIGLGVLILAYASTFTALALYLGALIKNKNTSYVVNGYRFGQGQFNTTLETHKFAKILIKTIGIGFLMLISIVIFTVIMMALTGGLAGLLSLVSGDSEAIKVLFSGPNINRGLGLSYIAVLLSSFIVVAYFQAHVRQYVFDNTLLNENVSFSSSLTTRALAWLMISNFVLLVMTLGLATPWAKVRRAQLILKNTLVDVESGFDGFITQQQEQQSALGEQVGDAFDIDIAMGV